MKTDLTTPGSFLQSQALSKKGEATLKAKAMPIEGKNIPKPDPDYKLDISKPKPTTQSASTDISIPDAPSAPKLSTPKIPDEIAKEAVKEEVKAEVVKMPEVKDGSVKKPAIIFIKGLDVFSSPSTSEGGYAGLGKIAESVEGAKTFSWSQKEEVIKEIKKVHADYPVILVGHSLGGDTAIEIADELDSLDQKFRSVDLLVTIDAIGFSHDIIPQNVKQHLNVFGENSLFLKDGPHVARRDEKTSVRNILSPKDHTEIDDDREVQFEVTALIQKTLGTSKT